MYKTFVISLAETGSGKHRESAQVMLRRTLSLCDKFHWAVEVFPAINGYELQEDDWKKYDLAAPLPSNKSDQKFANLKGAHGFFLSHFTLWNRCVELDEPIVILEDDADILAPMKLIDSQLDLIKLHDPRRLNKKPRIYGFAAPGAFAYWVTPVGAKKLIEFSRLHGPQHVDILMGSFVLNWGYLTPPIVKLGPRLGSSTNPIKHPYIDFVPTGL